MHLRRTGTALLAAAIAIAAAGTAAADSIVYVKDRNIWIANPDGTGNRQITTDGREYSSYTDPTQSDDGTSWASSWRSGTRRPPGTRWATPLTRCRRTSRSRPTASGSPTACTATSARP